MSGKQPLEIYTRPEAYGSPLVIGWAEDAGKLGPRVIDYLNERLGGEKFDEIDPEEFFPLEGVSVEDDVAQFPECKFYRCRESGLVTVRSYPPRSEWFKFLNLVVDVAEHQCHAPELYTFGAMISLSAHSTPRALLAVANSPEMKGSLDGYGLATDLDYETPPGQRPTLNSYLLWVAKGRKLPAASLWVPIPFYLVANEDPRAWKKILEFFDNRFDLSLDFRDLDDRIASQDERIDRVRLRYSEIDRYIRKLENNLPLSQEENERLVKGMEELLEKMD